MLQLNNTVRFQKPTIKSFTTARNVSVKTKSTQREEKLDKGVSDTAILSFYFSLFVSFPYP